MFERSRSAKRAIGTASAQFGSSCSSYNFSNPVDPPLPIRLSTTIYPDPLVATGIPSVLANPVFVQVVNAVIAGMMIDVINIIAFYADVLSKRMFIQADFPDNCSVIRTEL